MRLKLPQLVFIIIFLAGILSAFNVKADRASSTSFIVESGVVDVGGENADSLSFRLPSALSQPALGLSTSGGFRMLGGFLAFPFVSDPVLSATPGAEQVILNWTASDGFLGFNVSGYDIGTGTISDGQSFENAGNVLTFTKTGLSAGTVYFFKARAKDEFGEVIAVSNEATAVPASAAPPAPPGGAGGGGRGIARIPIPSILELLEKIAPLPAPCLPKTDLNCDGRINLTDFSIFLFLLPQPTPTPADFNSDQSVDVRDLSLLFFDWTDKVLAFAAEPTALNGRKAEPGKPYFAVITESIGFEPSKPFLTAESEAPKILPRISQFFWSVVGLIAAILNKISLFIQSFLNL